PGHDLRLALLEEIRDACERAAGAGRADEAVQLALGLLPELGCCRLVMAAPVGDIVELIGPNGAVRLALGELVRHALGNVHVIAGILVWDGGYQVKLRTAEPQHVLLLLALRLGHDDHGAVATRVADECQADAGVARGTLDDDAPRAQGAARLRVLDDGQGRPVLDRAARVQELGLAEDGAAGQLGRVAQLDERGVADAPDEAVSDLHGEPLPGRFLSPHSSQSVRADQGAASTSAAVALTGSGLGPGALYCGVAGKRTHTMHTIDLSRWRHEHVFLGRSHRKNERKAWAVIGLTATMMVVELVAGSLYGSMALIADGWHMATHVGALGITALAYYYARRHASDPAFSF